MARTDRHRHRRCGHTTTTTTMHPPPHHQQQSGLVKTEKNFASPLLQGHQDLILARGCFYQTERFYSDAGQPCRRKSTAASSGCAKRLKYDGDDDDSHLPVVRGVVSTPSPEAVAAAVRSPPDGGEEEEGETAARGGGEHPDFDLVDKIQVLYTLSDDPARKEFLDELFDFMLKNGSPLMRVPIMGGNPLDLFELFKQVVARGGVLQVMRSKQWREIREALGLPATITSAAFTLRVQYVKYLYPFECHKLSLSQPHEVEALVEGNQRDTTPIPVTPAAAPWMYPAGPSSFPAGPKPNPAMMDPYVHPAFYNQQLNNGYWRPPSYPTFIPQAYSTNLMQLYSGFIPSPYQANFLAHGKMPALPMNSGAYSRDDSRGSFRNNGFPECTPPSTSQSEEAGTSEDEVLPVDLTVASEDEVLPVDLTVASKDNASGTFGHTLASTSKNYMTPASEDTTVSSSFSRDPEPVATVDKAAGASSEDSEDFERDTVVTRPKDAATNTRNSNADDAFLKDGGGTAMTTSPNASMGSAVMASEDNITATPKDENTHVLEALSNGATDKVASTSGKAKARTSADETAGAPGSSAVDADTGSDGPKSTVVDRVDSSSDDVTPRASMDHVVTGASTEQGGGATISGPSGRGRKRDHSQTKPDTSPRVFSLSLTGWNRNEEDGTVHLRLMMNGSRYRTVVLEPDTDDDEGNDDEGNDDDDKDQR